MRHPRPRNPKTIADTEKVGDAITSVTSPMLVVVGAIDPLVPNAQRLHRLVPHSRYVAIPEAPHNVYWEAAVEWNAAVDEFLSDAPAK
jgi:pimeloyl-ACP methyl ester carboxylesterase